MFGPKYRRAHSEVFRIVGPSSRIMRLGQLPVQYYLWVMGFSRKMNKF